MKNLLHPLLVAGLCALLGIRGLSAVVIIVAAALPTGATVFMFAQRYGVARDQVASAVAFSTAVALGVLPVAMLAAQWLL
jgi:predicted permease